MNKTVLVTTFLLVFVMAGVGSAGVWDKPAGNVYWGDFHIHTQFSLDAFMGNMPKGRYVREAGQYALYCSKLDFYAVTDHSEMMTRRDYWPEAIAAAHSINDIGASRPDDNGDPRIVAFTGWEWTSNGPYGHKNVILKWDDPAKLPPSPIRFTKGIFLKNDAVERAGKGIGVSDLANGLHLLDLIRGIRYGARDATWVAPRPEDLFRMLKQNCLDKGNGCDAIVIPHGNAWHNSPGMYTSWTKQLNPRQHNPQIQTLIEVYSKHGNSEEYKPFAPEYRYYRNGKEISPSECGEEYIPAPTNGAERIGNLLMPRLGGVDMDIEYPIRSGKGCEMVCQEPTESYMPCCWRAGEIVRERCVDPKGEFCKEQVNLARQTSKPFSRKIPGKMLGEIRPEYRDGPGATDPAEWQTCGQCRDCFQPAFNYIPDGSVQKALASAYFDPDGTAHHYNFGFIGSTDTHSAWGGSVKETKRMVEVRTADVGQVMGHWPGFAGWERGVDFLNPGGIVAIISPRRAREDLWRAVKAKRVYGTSGPRMEVWARAEAGGKVVDMGAQTTSHKNPTFHIRANGPFKESQNCPYDDEPEISSNLTRQQFFDVCLNQCYRATDERVKIARVEVVKILQPMTPDENDMENPLWSKDNPGGLIFDPYYVADIPGKSIEWTWTDKNFVKEPAGRSVAYYFRVILEPTEGYNCNPTYLLEKLGKSCDAYSPDRFEVEKKINPQDGSQPATLASISDPCYTNVNDPNTYCEERAWTSPFYIERK